MAAASKTQTRVLGRLLPLLAILAALGLAVAALRWIDVDWEALASLGYGGLFLANLAASGLMIVPVPAVLFVFLAGSTLNPLLVGVVSGLGSAIGELTGYLLGRSGRVTLAGATGGSQGASRLDAWAKRYGVPAIFALAFIPNPIFDIAGVAAGAAKLSPGTFFAVVLVGRTARMTLFALAGHYGLTWVLSLIQ